MTTSEQVDTPNCSCRMGNSAHSARSRPSGTRMPVERLGTRLQLAPSLHSCRGGGCPVPCRGLLLSPELAGCARR